MASDKPKVLLVSRNLPPLVGGMERLLHEAALGIAEYADLAVIGPRGCRAVLPAGVDVREAPPGLLPFLLVAWCKTLLLACTRPFGVVAGGSGITAPIVWCAGKLARARTVVLVHGLDIVVPHPVYRAVFLPFIRGIDAVIANSDNTRRLAQEQGVPAARISIVNPGTALPPRPADSDLAAFRDRYGIRYPRFIVFVGRQTRRKGLSGFLSHCLPAILAAQPELGLLVVGSDPQDSLNRLGEQDAILEAIERNALGEQVQFLGVVDDDMLHLCYASAEVQVFPLIDVPGDIEGFGMVAVEAAASGTPTVAFDLGGVADAISPENGILVTPGDYAAFADAVLAVIESGEPSAQRCIDHAHNFSWAHYNAALRTHFAPDDRMPA